MEKDIEKELEDEKIQEDEIEEEQEDESEELDEVEEEPIEFFLADKFDDNGYLENPDFQYFICKVYTRDILKNFTKKYFDYAVKMFDFSMEKINDGTIEDIDVAVSATKESEIITKDINEFDKEAKIAYEKRIDDQLEKLEKIIIDKRRYKDELWTCVKELSWHRVYRPLTEFYMKGYSYLPEEKKEITKELDKENRDFSSIIAKDYPERLELLSVRDYLKNYIKFLVYISVSTGRGVLTEDEIRTTFNNSIKPLAKEIHDKYYKEPMPYNHKYQEMIENKTEVYNLSSKERMNLLKNLKDSIIESLDNKYDTKNEYLLRTQKQKFLLMKEAVYNQSIWKKIFKFGQFLKEKNELIEVSDRLCSSLHISKDKLFDAMENYNREYTLFIDDSKSLYDAAKNDCEEIIKEVKENNVYKAEIKVEEVSVDKEIDNEKDLSNVKDLNLEFEVIDESEIKNSI